MRPTRRPLRVRLRDVLPILAALLLWLPALVGLGIASARVAGLYLECLPGFLRLAVSIALGTATLSVVGVLANFVVALGPGASIVALVTGAGCLAVFGKRALSGVGWGAAAVTLGVCLLGARVAAEGSGHYDIGLYHLEAIRWITEQAAPLGLANLHVRLGYSGPWFALVALLELPGAAGCGGCFAGVVLAVALALLACSGVGGVLRGELRVSYVFSAMSLLALLQAAGAGTIASSSSDWPVTVVALVLVSLCLRALEGLDVSGSLVPMAAVLAAFAIAVKWSALPLAAVPIATMFAARVSRSGRSPRSIRPAARWRLLVAVGLLLGAALARNLWVSGYPLYPSSFAGLNGLSWAVPREIADTEVDWIRSWARAPGQTPQETLSSWSWVGPWTRSLVGNRNVVTLGVLCAVGLVLLLLARVRGRLDRQLQAMLLATALPAVGGLGFWFLTAPELRFGMVYVLVLSFTFLACGVVAAGRNLLHSVWIRSCLALAVGCLVLVKSLPYASRPTNLWRFPSFKQASLSIHETAEGVPVAVPRDGDQCWRATLPCTPLIRDGLRIVRSPSGRYRLFAIAHGSDARR